MSKQLRSSEVEKVQQVQGTLADEMYGNNAEKKSLTDVQLAEMRKRDHEMVRGVFRNKEQPGGTLENIPFLKYRGDKVQYYTFEDGKIYTIPRMVAKHLVNGCWYPENAYKQDKNGVPVATINRKTHRFGFESLDFMDVESMRELTATNIEEVTFLKEA